MRAGSSDAAQRRPLAMVTRLLPEPGPSLLAAAFQLVDEPRDLDLSHEDLLERVVGIDALVCVPRDRVGGDVMDAAGSRLRVISNYAVGYDNVDVAEATRRGILVTNTPGVLTETTADLAWALILGAARRVSEGEALVRSGGFRGITPTLLLGRDVHGKTLGVVGMGRIGRAVARRAVGFDMRVLYARRSGPLAPDEVPPGADWGHRMLGELLAQSDVVTVHVPLATDTHHLIGAGELRLMRPGSVLVNTSRGPVVDERALVEALRSGHLGGAGLDVYEEEPHLAPGLAALPNTLLLPHIGSATYETRGRMAELAARNAVAAVAGHPVPHAVNPEVLA